MMRLFLAVAMLLIAGCASRPWATASAVAVPNPVMLGPVQTVGGVPPASKGVEHPLRELRASMFGGNFGREWAGKVVDTERVEAANQLAFEIWRSLVGVSLMDIEERHRPSDIVSFTALRLKSVEYSDGQNKVTDTYLTLFLLDPKYTHTEASSKVKAAPPATPTAPAPILAEPAAPVPIAPEPPAVAPPAPGPASDGVSTEGPK